MDNYFLNFLVNILLMAFGIFSVLELIYDKSVPGSFFRKIKKRGWLLISCAILSIGFNIYKDWREDSKQEASEKAKARVDSLLQASQLSAKDTIIKKVEESYANSIKASNEALAKYNLKFNDSLHAVVSTLKLNSVNPQLLVAPFEPGKQPVFLSTNKDKKTFNIQFISKGGTCYHIYLRCYFLEQITHMTLLESDTIALGENFLTEGVSSTYTTYPRHDMLIRPDVIIFITGSFSKDPQGAVSIPFNAIIRFNFVTNSCLEGLEGDYNQLRKILNIN